MLTHIAAGAATGLFLVNLAFGAPQSVDALGEAYLREMFSANPNVGTYAGDHTYDGAPVDLSAGAIRKFRAALEALDREVAEYIGANPTGEDSLRARALKADIDTRLFAIDVMRAPRRDPMFYASAVDVSIYAKRDFAPESERMAHAAGVLDSVPAIVEAAEHNLDPVLSRIHIATAIDIAEGQADFVDHDLLAAFAASPDAEALARLTASANAAAAAMRGYADWLRAERLPGATDDFAIGAEAFARMLSDEELIDTPLDRILAIAQRELEAQTVAFTAAAHMIDPSRPAIDVWTEVQKDHPAPSALVGEAQGHLAEIRRFFVDKGIIRFPTDYTVEVRETPSFLRATTFASMDVPGPFETKATESYYYVTPPDADWDATKTEEWMTAFNYYTTDVVSIHEAYPGHFEQAMHLNTSDVRGAFRYLGSYAFIEGWAHYCEQMALDEGFPPASLRAEPHAAEKYRMAQATEALLRLCRLITTIRMHTQGMTIDEATRYFVDHCYYSEQAVRAEAERAAYEPQVCLYTIGKLQMLKLRADWMAQEGDAYTLKRFHDEVLRHGQPPILLLRERMLKDSSIWIATLPG